VRRVSGALLDRLDLRVEMPRIPAADLLLGPEPEGSRVVASRIAAARRRGVRRNGGRLNARLSGRDLVERCGLEPPGRELLALVAARRGLSARGIHRILRVARAVADLASRDVVTELDVLAAADLRDPMMADRPGLAA